jgi:hypothetical protein
MKLTGTRVDIEFIRGFLCAAAQVARRGESTLAVELSRECGVSNRRELQLLVPDLDAFDAGPLRKVLPR